MNRHEQLNYVELASTDLSATKTFFSTVFQWQFEDFGDKYTAFNNQGLNGGFYLSDKVNLTENGGTLLVFYSQQLSLTYDKIVKNSGSIVQETFAFPCGYRFHFTEPSGYEFAVWSEDK